MTDLRPSKKPRLTPMTWPLLEVLVEHGVSTTTDLLCYAISTNADNRFLVVEAFAGCGKTTMLVELIRRMSVPQNILLLSYTNSATKVARRRLVDAGIYIHSQTFDSMFYHAVSHAYPEYTHTQDHDYQVYRDMASILTCDVLSLFECKARSRYHLEDIGVVLVDEAQDSPPEAIHFLRRLQQLGKTVVCVGDRWQNIFSFQGACSLFDQISTSEKTILRMRHTRRCCPSLTYYIRHRFGVQIESNAPVPESFPETMVICVQARCNSTLAKLYARFLFAQSAPIAVDVAQGESQERFEQALYEHVRMTYRLDTEEDVREVIHHRQRVLAARKYKPLSYVFSTVHHYKGDECDITLLAGDIHLTTKSLVQEEEYVKYVAVTRARYGCADLDDMMYHGEMKAYEEYLARCTYDHAGKNMFSGVLHNDIHTHHLMGISDFMPVIESAKKQACGVAGPALVVERHTRQIINMLFLWDVMHLARSEYGCAIEHISSDIASSRSVFRDYEYRRHVEEGNISVAHYQRTQRLLQEKRLQVMFARYLVLRGEWQIDQDECIQAASTAISLRTFHMTRNILELRPATTVLPCAAIRKVMCRRQWRQDLPPSPWRVALFSQPALQGRLNANIMLECVIVAGSQNTPYVLLPRLATHVVFRHFLYGIMLEQHLVQAFAPPPHSPVVCISTLSQRHVVDTVQINDATWDNINKAISSKTYQSAYYKRRSAERILRDLL